MDAETPRYKRLSPRRRRMFTMDSVWEGKDHLLVVESVRVSESYTRYAYRDLKAVFVTPSDEMAVTAVVLGFVALLYAIAVLSLGDGKAPWFAYAIIEVPLLILFALNLLQGKACKFYIVTGVQTVRLHALGRRKKALKALAVIQAHVLEAQADLIPKPAEPPTIP